MASKNKVGIALGAGSARGLAHIGVLKVLEKENIPIDFISGSSAGALVGAFYAAGISPSNIERIAKSVDWGRMWDFTYPQSGLVRGKRVEKFIRKAINAKSFKELDVPCSFVAVDIKSGERIVFEDGDVAKAVRASISIPALFEPVRMGNMLLVDGGILDPVPVDVLKNKVKMTIALDLTLPPSRYHTMRARKGKKNLLNNNVIIESMEAFRNYLRRGKLFQRAASYVVNPKRVVKFLTRSYVPPVFRILGLSHSVTFSEMARLQLKVAKPDIIIKPDLKDLKPFDFSKVDFCVKEGERATIKSLKEIKRKLKQVGIT